jgi:hypothetical protein
MDIFISSEEELSETKDGITIINTSIVATQSKCEKPIQNL